MNQQPIENNEGISSKAFFLLIGSVVAGALAFSGILHAKNLEEHFIYKENNRIETLKNQIFQTECRDPRDKQERLVKELEASEGMSSLRMTEAYTNGWKEHREYASGGKIVTGEAYVQKACDEAIKHVSTIKQADSTEYVLTHFFGGK